MLRILYYLLFRLCLCSVVVLYDKTNSAQYSRFDILLDNNSDRNYVDSQVLLLIVVDCCWLPASRLNIYRRTSSNTVDHTFIHSSIYNIQYTVQYFMLLFKSREEALFDEANTHKNHIFCRYFSKNVSLSVIRSEKKLRNFNKTLWCVHWDWLIHCLVTSVTARN